MTSTSGGAIRTRTDPRRALARARSFGTYQIKMAPLLVAARDHRHRHRLELCARPGPPITTRVAAHCSGRRKRRPMNQFIARQRPNSRQPVGARRRLVDLGPPAPLQPGIAPVPSGTNQLKFAPTHPPTWLPTTRSARAPLPPAVYESQLDAGAPGPRAPGPSAPLLDRPAREPVS